VGVRVDGDEETQRKEHEREGDQEETRHRVLAFGVGQSFAKFREKFARGAAGAEIFRNLPLTAPLASQAHAVHMYRISMERCMAPGH